MLICAKARTLCLAGGYGIGLTSAYSCLISSALLVCNDIRSFQRLEIRETEPNSSLSSAPLPPENEHAEPNSPSQSGPVVQRTKRTVYGISGSSKETHPTHSEAATRPYTLVWQAYPSTLYHCIDWTADLLTSLRGVGWTYRLSVLPPVDAPHPENPTTKKKPVSSDLKEVYTVLTFDDIHTIRNTALKDFLLLYFFIDFIKTIMITDPYFLGRVPLSSPTPWNWLAFLNGTIPFATSFVRLMISLLGVMTALSLIFTLGPLFFAWILPSLTDISKITRAPLLEPFMYPAQWWPFSSSVLDKGLAGFWGKYWHQLMRFYVAEPGRVIVQTWNLAPRGQVARVVQLLVGFALSGAVHFLGSWTSTSPQKSFPLRPWTFFFCQGIGILLQTAFVKGVYKIFPGAKSLPVWVRRAGNGIFVLLYLSFTGPVLANDFAASGIWLFEPVPISLLRGFGFGPGGEGEGFWVWTMTGKQIGFWRGPGGWWESGLAVF